MTGVALRELVAKVALSDDGLAYKKLFLHFQPKLLSFSFAITHCKESSEEAVSDVFLNIWKNRSKILQVENFALYLYVSTKNISLNYLTKQKRNQVTFLEEIKMEFACLHYNPERMMITAEMFRRLQKAIKQLPPKCQLIFKLIKEDGLSYREVAELLQLSLKTVENQMTIAMRKLGESIALKQAISLS